MDATSLRKLLEQVRSGTVSPDEAVSRLRHMPFEDLGFAKIDHHRRVRSGMPEVIFSQGKTPDQVAKIFKRMAAQGGNVLATKASPEHFRAVKKIVRKAEYRELARAIALTEPRFGVRPAARGRTNQGTNQVSRRLWCAWPWALSVSALMS